MTLAVLDARAVGDDDPDARPVDVPGYTEIAEITGIAGTGRRGG